jgi:hypothetical protein
VRFLAGNIVRKIQNVNQLMDRLAPKIQNAQIHAGISQKTRKKFFTNRKKPCIIKPLFFNRSSSAVQREFPFLLIFLKQNKTSLSLVPQKRGKENI